MTPHARSTTDVGTDAPLSWARMDIEQRFMFRGGRHTRVNMTLALLSGVLFTAIFYGLLIPFRESTFARMFYCERWEIPCAIVFFSCWSLAILMIKGRKLSLQRKALGHDVVPKDATFVLSAGNVDDVMDAIYRIVDDPKHFVVFNRIVVALANLRNLGRVGDVDEILKSQADNDEAATETSYVVISGFVWAIPVLGFIGTVLGLSSAIGGFGAVLQDASQDMGAIRTALKGVTGGLATAFTTTLQALVAALVIQLYLTFLKKSEHEFLEECSEYCTRQIVNHLRIMPYERFAETE